MKLRVPQSLTLRILSACIAVPLVLLTIRFGGWILFFVGVCFVCLAMFELRALLRHIGYRPVAWFGLLGSLYLLVTATPSSGYKRKLMIWCLVMLAIGLVFACIAYRKYRLADWAATFIMTAYIGLPFACLLALRYRNVWWILVALVGTWAFDTGAFFVGKSIGRHALAPRISPKKTWEGFFGGLIITTLVACITMTPFHLSWYINASLGVLIAIAATCGDLVESLVKRKAKVKDSGSIMPGHGGVLDRVDSILFVAPIVFLWMQLFQK